MSVRNLEALFQPASVAVIGASDRAGSVGSLVLRNLKQGGFKGPIWPVNKRRARVGGDAAWPDVESLPQPPDLAVICTPAGTVPDLIAALGRKGTRAAIVVTAGLKQPTVDGGPSLEQAMLDAARPHLLRILGPNCIGALVPGVGLNASFALFRIEQDKLAELNPLTNAYVLREGITTKGAEPAFIHCAGGNRAATMWLIKRIAVDHWDVDRATKEATLLGQTNPTMRQFAIDFAQAHRR